MRGPDGSGTMVLADGRVSLGHTRLAVLDLSHAADQPMSAGQAPALACLNGEI
jgi:asparagine synthase (glutamine-hydrolysing)